MGARPYPSVMMMQGGAGPGCVWNPATLFTAHTTGGDTGSLATPLQLSVNQAGATAHDVEAAVIGTVGKHSGKWYFEVSKAGWPSGGSQAVGISQQPATAIGQNFGLTSGFGCALYDGGFLYDADTFGSVSGYPSNINSIIMCAVDLTNNLIWFGVNGTFVGNPAAGTGGKSILHTTYYPAAQTEFSSSSGAGTATSTASFNAGSFAYTPPAGFAAWR